VRIASDLLFDKEDPGAIGRIIADAIRSGNDTPGRFAETLSPHAFRFGLQRGNGLALLRWLLELTGDEETPKWMDAARRYVNEAGGSHHPPSHLDAMS
jgi:hypothetical protein